MMTPLFFIVIQVFLNLHPTIVDSVKPEDVIGLNAQPPDSRHAYWISTRDIMDKTLHLPVNINPVISGNLLLLPERFRNELMDIFRQCRNLKLLPTAFNDLQSMVVDMIVAWKYLREYQMMKKMFENFKKKTLEFFQDGAQFAVDTSVVLYYRSLYEVIQIDYFPTTTTGHEIDRPLKLIRLLPQWCRLKIGLLRVAHVRCPPGIRGLVNKRIYAEIIRYLNYQKLIKNEIKGANEQMECYERNELRLALNITIVLNSVIRLLERKTPWFQDNIHRFNIIKPEQKPVVLQEIAFPDILEITRFLPHFQQCQVDLLYRCYRNMVREYYPTVKEAQVLLLKKMLEYINSDMELEDLTLEIGQLFKACTSLGIMKLPPKNMEDFFQVDEKFLGLPEGQGEDSATALSKYLKAYRRERLSQGETSEAADNHGFVSLKEESTNMDSVDYNSPKMLGSFFDSFNESETDNLWFTVLDVPKEEIADLFEKSVSGPGSTYEESIGFPEDEPPDFTEEMIPKQ